LLVFPIVPQGYFPLDHLLGRLVVPVKEFRVRDLSQPVNSAPKQIIVLVEGFYIQEPDGIGSGIGATGSACLHAASASNIPATMIFLPSLIVSIIFLIYQLLRISLSGREPSGCRARMLLSWSSSVIRFDTIRSSSEGYAAQ
jgi:hypothetical protein